MAQYTVGIHGNFTYVQDDELYHHRICSYCGWSLSLPHTWKSGVCTACDLPMIAISEGADGLVQARVLGFERAEDGAYFAELNTSAEQVCFTIPMAATAIIPAESAAVLRALGCELTIPWEDLPRVEGNALRVNLNCRIDENGSAFLSFSLTDSIGAAVSKEAVLKMADPADDGERTLCYTQGESGKTLRSITTGGELCFSEGSYELLRFHCEKEEGGLILRCSGTPYGLHLLAAGYDDSGRQRSCALPRLTAGSEVFLSLPGARQTLFLLDEEFRPLVPEMHFS